MSGHKIQYRILPCNDRLRDNSERERADTFIKGVAYSFDKNEAFSIAKKAAKSCQFPFVVLEVSLPIKYGCLYGAWTVYA